MNDLKTIISRFKNRSILVIGDVILDQHIKGNVSRISPEAPVPIVLQEGFPLFAPGGAANVANNLTSLGAKVTFVGRVGKDNEAKILLKELHKRKIRTEGIFVDKSTPTIVKTRIIAQHQQVLRLDREKSDGFISQELTEKIINYIHRQIKNFDGLIISDYGKGMISSHLVEKVCALALMQKKIITVDPKDDHFAYYKGVSAITPNKKETENAIRNIKITQNNRRDLKIHTDKLNSLSDIEEAGFALLKFLKLESLLITLGDQGMYLFEKGKKGVHIHTKAKEVYDVTGAGDTVISVFTLSLAAGATKHQAADLANYAAGVVVGKMGPVAITKQELLDAIKG